MKRNYIELNIQMLRLLTNRFLLYLLFILNICTCLRIYCWIILLLGRDEIEEINEETLSPCCSDAFHGVLTRGAK